MTHLAPRPWVPAACEARVQSIAADATQPSDAIAARIEALIVWRTLRSMTKIALNLNRHELCMNPVPRRSLARVLGGASLAWVSP